MKKLTIGDKPTRRVTYSHVPHGVKPQIVVTVYPAGIIGFRELGRRKEYQLDVGVLYVSAIRNEVAKKKAEKKKKRSGR